jgi:hypothetical protein
MLNQSANVRLVLLAISADPSPGPRVPDSSPIRILIRLSIFRISEVLPWLRYLKNLKISKRSTTN